VPNEIYEERSVAIFLFCGAFKQKLPFSFVTFLLGKQKKSKEDEQRTKAEYGSKSHKELVKQQQITTIYNNPHQ
jgi:hypothetical protein